MPPDKQLVFGPFRLDLRDVCLWQGPKAISLTPKAFDVLHYLARRPRQLVLKDELLDAVWPNAYVTDAVLKVCIGTLRKQLGDQSRHSRYIETVHRRGYRFVADVTTIQQRHAHGGEHNKIANGRSGLLMGRECVLAQIQLSLQRMLAGKRQLVFVTGELGVGKTATVDAFLQRAKTTHPNLLVAHGQCIKHYGKHEAYFSILEALSVLCRDPLGQPLVDAIKQYAPHWLSQLPWLLNVTDRTLFRNENLDTMRQSMLREMANALRALTQKTPLVLVLEDLQWSDFGTVDLLTYLARRQELSQLLIIGTYRPMDIALNGQHPLKSVQQELQMRDQCKEIALSLLSEAEVGDYLRARFPGSRFPKAFARVLHRRSEGNPLYLVNMLDLLIERGVMTRFTNGWQWTGEIKDIEQGVPESLRHMIEKGFQLKPGQSV